VNRVIPREARNLGPPPAARTAGQALAHSPTRNGALLIHAAASTPGSDCAAASNMGPRMTRLTHSTRPGRTPSASRRRAAGGARRGPPNQPHDRQRRLHHQQRHAPSMAAHASAHTTAQRAAHLVTDVRDRVAMRARRTGSATLAQAITNTIAVTRTSHIAVRASSEGLGPGRDISRSTRLNIAALAPRARARVTTTVAAKPGVRRSHASRSCGEVRQSHGRGGMSGRRGARMRR
jgi:hypothetical protein